MAAAAPAGSRLKTRKAASPAKLTPVGKQHLVVVFLIHHLVGQTMILKDISDYVYNVVASGHDTIQDV